MSRIAPPRTPSATRRITSASPGSIHPSRRAKSSRTRALLQTSLLIRSSSVVIRWRSILRPAAPVVPMTPWLSSANGVGFDRLAGESNQQRRAPARSPAPEVGDGIHTLAGNWTFGGKVPDAFDSHIARSVPAYAECHDLIADLADQLLPAGGRCYDLGCSTGALTALLAERLAPRRAEVIGVDREPEMIKLAA